MKAMQDACKDPENYKYALADLPELLKAVQYRYEKRFGVRVETDEIMVGVRITGVYGTYWYGVLQSGRYDPCAESRISDV